MRPNHPLCHLSSKADIVGHKLGEGVRPPEPENRASMENSKFAELPAKGELGLQHNHEILQIRLLESG